MSKIILNHKIYPFEVFTKGQNVINWAALSPYETKVIQFCQQWFRGQEYFTLNTSGSTGSPKAIQLGRKQMQSSARLTGQALQLQPGDKALVCLSVAYIAGLMMLVRGFELDLELTIVEPTSHPLDPFESETQFDFTALVPLQLEHILRNTPEKKPILDRMQAILIGGAPVSVALMDQLQYVTSPIYHTYGMTETVTHIALKRLNGPQVHDRFIPLPGIKLGLDGRGCLTICSAVTNYETLTTNDLVDLHPDGSFSWLGRIDHVINSGGVKVQIEKVEKTLEHLFYFYRDGLFAQRRFLVGPCDHPTLGQTVIAVIEGEPFPADVQAEMRLGLLNALHKYEVPRQFFFVEHLQETPTGKIDRPANLALNRPLQATPIHG